MGTEKSSNGRKLEPPWIMIEPPVRTSIDAVDAVVAQVMNISAKGIQLKMKCSDLEALKKMSEACGQENCFKIPLIARLAWASPEQDGTFKTGWEFNLLDGEERIG